MGTAALVLLAALPVQAGDKTADRIRGAEAHAEAFVAELRKRLGSTRLMEFSVTCLPVALELPRPPGMPPEAPCGSGSAKVQSAEDPFGVDGYRLDGRRLTGPEPERLFRRMTQEDLDDCLFDLDSVDTSVIPGLAQDAVSRLRGQLTMVTLSRGCDTGPPIARSPYQGPNEMRWRVSVQGSRSQGSIWYDLAGNVRFQSQQ